MRCAWLVVAVGLGACGGAAAVGGGVALRPACAAATRWDGGACAPRGDDAARIEAARVALGEDLDRAEALVASLATHGPLDHAEHVALWEVRGILAGYLGDEAGARAAFRRLLDLAPQHGLRHTLSPRATQPFEAARGDAERAGAPAIDLTWRQGQRVGAPVELEVERVADPSGLLARVEVHVRGPDEAGWRVLDLGVVEAPRWQRAVVPAVRATRDVSLAVYARAYDAAGDEVLRWASAEHPREVPLRYVAPTPWHRRWWVWTVAGTVAAGVAGTLTWALTREPPDDVPIAAGAR